jgi:hypothetical protein
MSNRNEFPARIKSILALRANHRCSFEGCGKPTSGPSQESPQAVSMTGKAAHIHAASRGGPRYLASMTREERMDISNGIWLCSEHADLIDKDEVTYTPEVLPAMRAAHEAVCAKRQRHAAVSGVALPDLVAIGPDIVFVGELTAADVSEWRFNVEDFVEGDLHRLITYNETFDQVPPMDRYALVNALGEGRNLKAAPSLSRDEKTGNWVVKCPVLPSAERILASELPTDLALGDDHDLFATPSGGIATVSGVDALPQRLKTSLSFEKGESPFHHDAGTRLGEYYKLLSDSPWFEHFLKLELIRQAAIPNIDQIMARQDTPLLCIERVFGIELLADAPTNNSLPVRLDLQVKGIGRRQFELPIYIPAELRTYPSIDDHLAGPQGFSQRS